MKSAVVGSTKKRKFIVALLSGFIIFGSFLATLGFTGTVFALPLGGMGDFYVTFDKLEGEAFTLKPHTGETGNQDQAPLVRNEMETATIENLHIYKDLKLPMGNWVRINVEADQPSEIEGLIQDARFIDADLSFDEMAIEEKNTSSMSIDEAFQKNWTQSADNVTITDAKIVTDYLFQNMVTLNDAKISLERIDEPEIGGDGNDSDSIGGAIGQNDDNNDNNGKGDDSSPNRSGNGNHSDSNTSEIGSSDDNGGNVSRESGLLPNTASNWGLPIVIGVVLTLLGAVLLVRKRKRKSQLTEEG